MMAIGDPHESRKATVRAMCDAFIEKCFQNIIRLKHLHGAILWTIPV